MRNPFNGKPMCSGPSHHGNDTCLVIVSIFFGVEANFINHEKGISVEPESTDDCAIPDKAPYLKFF